MQWIGNDCYREEIRKMFVNSCKLYTLIASTKVLIIKKTLESFKTQIYTWYIHDWLVWRWSIFSICDYKLVSKANPEVEYVWNDWENCNEAIIGSKHPLLNVMHYKGQKYVYYFSNCKLTFQFTIIR